MHAQRDGVARVLVVDDEPLMLGMFGDCVVHAGYAPLLAGTKQAAIDQLDTQLLAAIVDVWLPDGSGFDVVQSAKTTHPELPVIMVTGLNDAYVANRAQLLGAEYACKPDVRANVREFLRRCAPPNSVNAVLAEFATRCRITPAERRLLAAALERRASHDSLSDQLGVSVNTIKKQIASVLEKARANTLEEVVAPLSAPASSAGSRRGRSGAIRLRARSATVLGARGVRLRSVARDRTRLAPDRPPRRRLRQGFGGRFGRQAA